MRPSLEGLERRSLLASFVVTSVDDAGPGSLRQAIAAANQSKGPDRISFAIGQGAQTLTPASALPTITDPLVIDGTTQPGFAGSPLIEIDGEDAGTMANGLRIASGGSTVRGLVINRFGANGILLETGGGNVVEGNFIGTDASGTSALGNTGTGILIAGGSSGNRIGGSSPGSSNVISGNIGDGISASIQVDSIRSITVASTDVPKDIPDPGTLSSALPIVGLPADDVVAHLRVTLSIRHPFDGDLTMTLVSPQGTRVVLAARRGDRGDNFTDTVFDDRGGQIVDGDAAPFTGLYKPEQALGNLNGQTADGTWHLEVNDAAENDSGTLLKWSLQIDSGRSKSGPGFANLIAGNKIGTDLEGTSDLGNGGSGITLASRDNTVGGTTAGARNVIGANKLQGILIIGPKSSGNRILGNYLGLAADGSTDLGNANNGILVSGAPGNRIGGTSPSTRNVISGNAGIGIWIIGDLAKGNLVEGNYVGTDAAGQVAVANDFSGVRVEDAPAITIGGTVAGTGNLISGNGAAGVFVLNAASIGNVIQGNIIGLDASGLLALGNGSTGISLSDSPGNLVGGTVAGARNVVSANGGRGVAMAGEGASGNVVQGNYIGVSIAGGGKLGNSDDGVGIFSGSGNLIGGATLAARNVISGNGDDGVNVRGSASSGNRIQGNLIGTDATGQVDLGNSFHGVNIENAPRNLVGGPILGQGNLISGNGGEGVYLIGTGTTGSVVQGNFIGTDATGSRSIPNDFQGILLDESPANLIGGTVPAARNLISGNRMTGIEIVAPTSIGNLVQGNYIGTDASGSRAVPNGQSGIFLSNDANETIGGTSVAARNLISGNGTNGISIAGSFGMPDLIQGNYIGTDASGLRAVPNAQDGVVISQSGGQIIGGPLVGEGNLISGNGDNGVLVSGSSGPGNRIQGNFIGVDAGGRAALGNRGDGVFLREAAGTTVGGRAAVGRNVISGNALDGVHLEGLRTIGAVVQGNFIGLDATGSAPLGNRGQGVAIVDASNNLIGVYSDPSEGNMISGNALVGVLVSGVVASGNAIFGNTIGLDASATRPVGNGSDGIFLLNAPGTSIGAGQPLGRNLISGNLGHGVEVSGATATATRILGNFIGLDTSGIFAVGNLRDGVAINNAPDNTVGGATLGARNLIAGNALAGVGILGAGATGTFVVGNFIGTNVDGLSALGNGDGVVVDGASRAVIGGSTAGSGNLVSGNAGSGVLVNGSSTVLVLGNRIGTDASGLNALGNSVGIYLQGSQGVTVGGTTLGARNLISGNEQAGVYLFGSQSAFNTIVGDDIGVDASGVRALARPLGLTTGVARQAVGILINDSPNNVVGGPADGAGVVASGNLVGVYLSGFNASGNVVQGNRLGVDRSGRVGIGNTVGIFLNNAPGNLVGGPNPGEGNVISANLASGVQITGTRASGNMIQGNRIGTDLAGGSALPNLNGVYVENAPNNLIGGPSRASGNLISGNTQVGVYLYGADTTDNRVQGNGIGTRATGRGSLGNGQYGILLLNAPKNTLDKSKRSGNIIQGSGIAPVREFTGVVPTGPAKKKAVPAKLSRR